MPNGGPRPTGLPEDRGNAILSTLPLAEPSAIELPIEVQRRVAIAANVSGLTGDGVPWSLHVASGHLDTRSPWSRFADTFGAGRGRQARALSEHLDGNAIILGADPRKTSSRMLLDFSPTTPGAG